MSMLGYNVLYMWYVYVFLVVPVYNLVCVRRIVVAKKRGLSPALCILVQQLGASPSSHGRREGPARIPAPCWMDACKMLVELVPNDYWAHAKRPGAGTCHTHLHEAFVGQRVVGLHCQLGNPFSLHPLHIPSPSVSRNPLFSHNSLPVHRGLRDLSEPPGRPRQAQTHRWYV